MPLAEAESQPQDGQSPDGRATRRDSSTEQLSKRTRSARRAEDGLSRRQQELAREHEKLDMLQRTLSKRAPEDDEEGGRANAAMAEPDAMAASIRRARPQRELSEAERLAIAGIFVRHAITRTDVGSIEWSHRRARLLYRLAHRPLYLRVRLLALLGLCIVVCWEPAVTWGSPSAGNAWLGCGVTELLCLALLMLDVIVTSGYMGVCVFVRRWQRLVQLLIVCLLVGDAVPAFGTALASDGGRSTFRFARPLRPVLLPLLYKPCLTTIFSILRTLPSIVDLAVLAALLIFLATLAGVTLFSDADDGLAASGLQLDRPFATLQGAVVSLTTLLLTGDNFPSVMWSTWSDCSSATCSHPVSAAFFVSFVLLGTIMVMAVLVAVIFEVYKRQHAFIVSQGKLHERKALLAAFALLDLNQDGSIDVKEFMNLLNEVQPRANRQARGLLFKLVDADGSESVDAHEFVKCIDALLLKVTVAPDREIPRLLRIRWPAAHAVVENAWFQRAALGSIGAYMLVLAVETAATDEHAYTVARWCDVGFLGLFALELMIKVAGLSISGFWAGPWNRLDAVVLTVSVASFALEEILVDASPAVARVLRLLRLLRAARTFSVVSHVPRLRLLARTFLKMRFVMLPIGSVLLLLLYVFAVVGGEALGDRMDWPNDSPYCAGYPDDCPSFDTFAAACLTLFQLLIGANWSPVMLQAVSATESWSVAIFFVAFVVVGHVIILQLLAALILEIYSLETERALQEDARTREGLGLLFSPDSDAAPALTGEAAQRSADMQIVLSAGVRRIFSKYDTDRSGAIDVAELGMLLADLGEKFDEKELDALMDELDSDGSREVEYEEFLRWWQLHGVRKVFAKFDADCSGKIDVAELRPVLSQLGLELRPEEISTAMELLDKDGDGAIGVDEFVSWFDDFDVEREFRRFDTDHSGSISRHELRELTASLGMALSRKELGVAFERLDRDKSGLVTFDEFLPWWKEVKSRKQTSKFMIAGKTTQWEDSLFLDRADEKRQALKEQRRKLLAAIADDIDAGTELTRAYLLEAYSDPDANGCFGARRAVTRSHSAHQDNGIGSQPVERGSHAEIARQLRSGKVHHALAAVNAPSAAPSDFTRRRFTTLRLAWRLRSRPMAAAPRIAPFAEPAASTGGKRWWHKASASVRVAKRLERRRSSATSTDPPPAPPAPAPPDAVKIPDAEEVADPEAAASPQQDGSPAAADNLQLPAARTFARSSSSLRAFQSRSDTVSSMRAILTRGDSGRLPVGRLEPPARLERVSTAPALSSRLSSSEKTFDGGKSLRGFDGVHANARRPLKLTHSARPLQRWASMETLPVAPMEATSMLDPNVLELVSRRIARAHYRRLMDVDNTAEAAAKVWGGASARLDDPNYKTTADKLHTVHDGARQRVQFDERHSK